MSTVTTTEKVSALPTRATKAAAPAAFHSTASNSYVDLQRTLGNQATLHLLQAGIIKAKLRVSQPGDADEQEADRVADQVVSATRAPKIQRKCTCAGTGSSCPKCEEEETGKLHRSVASSSLRSFPLALQRAPAGPAPANAPEPAGNSPKPSPTPAHTHPLVVDDDAKSVAPHQMRKSAFIALLRADACATADAVLASVGHTTKSCPYIEKWLAFYEKQSSDHIEHAILKYAPETATARSAHEAIRLVVMRVQRAATTWAKTGKVSGLPEDLAGQLPGQGFLGAVHSFASSSVGGAILGFLGGSKPEKSGAATPADKSPTATVSRKASDPGAGIPAAHDAGAVRSQLGHGHSLDSRVQSQMSSAFGHDFSGVRVHTDSRAAALSSDLDARAFTIGSDVAFASGEYKPGTLVGDALIAHELAHVVQQGGGNGAIASPVTKSTEQSNHLEADADASANHAVTSMWTGAKSHLAAVGASAVPRLRSGLRLQRCPKQAQVKTPDTKTVAGGTPCPDSVRIGGTKSFNHGMLPEADKGRILTALGVVSLMEVGPGPDHTGHCMKETLSGTSDCPAKVFSNKEGINVGACGRPPKCLGIHQYKGRSMGFGLTHSSFPDSATSFIDLHITTMDHSVLGDSDPSQCTETCEQTYSCDRTNPTTGKFRITRTFKKDKYKMPDGTIVPITTGKAEKTNA